MCGPEEAVRVCITRCMLREDRGRCPGTWQEAGRNSGRGTWGLWILFAVGGCGGKEIFELSHLT